MGPKGEPERVVVSVGGRSVTEREFYRRILEKVGAHAIRRAVLLDVLFEEEARSRGIEVSEEDVDRAVARFVDGRAQEAGGLDRLESELEREGSGLDELRTDLRPQLRTELLVRRTVREMRAIDDSVLRKYFEATHKQKRWAARHIAISFSPREGETRQDVDRRRFEALDRARRIVTQVRAGEEFARLAQYESEDELTARMGGSIGAVTEDSPMPPEFKEVLFALEAGQVSEPVENPEQPAFHVFFVDEILPARTFAEAEADMRRELREREPGIDEIASAFDALRAEADIRWQDEG